MITEHLRIQQLTPAAYEHYLQYLAAMDDRNMTAYAAFLSEDCTLQMNNQEAVTGKAAIVAMLAPYWKSFSAIEHDLLNVYGNDSNYVLEALNHYVGLDGRHVTVRAVAFTDLDAAGKVSSVRLYTDVSPLFQK